MNFNENAIEISDIDLSEPLDATEFNNISMKKIWIGKTLKQVI